MPNKWSGCSVDDFKAHYQLFKNRDGKYCLEESKGNNPNRPPTNPGGGGGKVCVKVLLQTAAFYSKDISWKFGSCSSQNGKKYRNRRRYEFDCCQPKGNYEMICKDSYGDGWGSGAYIQVGRTKVCTNFTSGSQKSAMVKHG